MKFTQLPFHENVVKGIEAAGFSECTKVQEKVLPISLKNRDLMVQSKTGSGKTAVYLLTILQKIAIAIDNNEALPKALIVAPTRELAVQIKQDAKLLSSNLKVHVGVFYGGVGYEKQDKALKNCDIFVGTPGRLLDYQKSRKIDFKQFDIFVLDEADRMFDMGFFPDVQKMFSLLKNKDQIQTMLFSATLSVRVRNLAWSYMTEPVEIEVEPEEICVDKIDQELYHVAKDEKFQLFLYLMNKEKATNALIFTNTKAKAVELSKRLSLNNFSTKYLMGDMSQSKRLSTINRMKEGQIKFLVATDVAARGIQIDDLELVINYDIPEDFENYVHRIGRTARAGKTGKSITLACEEFIYGLEPIEKYIEMKIPVKWVDEELFIGIEDKSKNLRFRDLVSEKEYASKRNNNPNFKNSNSRNSKNKSFDKNKNYDKPKSFDKPNNFDKNKKVDKNNDIDKAKGLEKIKKFDKARAAKNNSTENPTQNRVNNSQKPNFSKPKKSYNDIQRLSLEERLNYYKEQYGGTQMKGKTIKPKTPNAPLERGQRPAKLEVSMKDTHVSKHPNKAKVDNKINKMGLFKKIFTKITKK
jgi:ATP-dependent RNA helicase RhlB